jgi:ribA/ribD-fused uncharacterized protein
MQGQEAHTYKRRDCVVFRKTNESFGGLSNMAGGYPLLVNGVPILTAEALYQACRFPMHPEIQRLIIQQRSPMTAKMKSKPHRTKTRPDWDRVHVPVMKWCLEVKLYQHRDTFGSLLESTGDRAIVEESRRDSYWGARPVEGDKLVGANVLGNLLMELRANMRTAGMMDKVEPLEIEHFLLLGDPIRTVKEAVAPNPSGSEKEVFLPGRSLEADQQDLFGDETL